MSTFPETLARRIGAAPPLPNGRPFLPSTPLDWALHHAATGVHVFPAENFVGNPLIEDWYDKATTVPKQIISWWTQWPTADIAAVPDRANIL